MNEKHIYEYTVTIYAPFDSEEIDVIALEAVNGAAICTEWNKKLVHEDELPTEAVAFFHVMDE